MCHYPLTQQTQQTKNKSYFPPVYKVNTVPNAASYVVDNNINTYWRISYPNEQGVEQSTMMMYNKNGKLDFIQSVKKSVKRSDIESITIIVPAPRPVGTPSHMKITDEKYFSRALALVPKDTGLYNPMCGMPVRVVCKTYTGDEKENEEEEGWVTTTSDDYH